MLRSCSLEAVLSQWLSMEGVLELGHFHLMEDFSRGQSLFRGSSQPARLSQRCTIHWGSSYPSPFASLSPFTGVRLALQSEGHPTYPALSPLYPSWGFPSINLLYICFHLAICFLGAHTSTEKNVTPVSNRKAEYSLHCRPRLLPFPPSHQQICWPTSFQAFLQEQKIHTKTDRVPCCDGGLPFHQIGKNMKQMDKNNNNIILGGNRCN